jgi:methylated-DNA-[protein]-cysteine S-methyltransferase
MKTQLVELPISTHDGEFIARYSEKGLAELDFPKVRTHRRGVRSDSLNTRRTLRRSVPTPIANWHRATIAALKNILAGRAATQLPPLDWSGKTEFQQSVWREMLKIFPGKTKSYGEIAQAIGKPKAVRAVGGACGANPIPVLVPCHRILAANQKIGGFSGGLDWKYDLLNREGIVFSKDRFNK